MELGVLDILRLYGFNAALRTKFARHQQRDFPPEELRRWLELYQSYQGGPVFHHIDQLVSFYGMTGTRAGFYGVYRVLGHKPASQGRILQECQWSSEWRRNTTFFYNLERDRRFDHLRDRLIIDWGQGALAWHQKPTNKALLQIQEAGRRLPPFDDYLEFSLTYDELKELFANEGSNQEWRARLSAVGGIYLILAAASGDLYVGSAYGKDGIGGRWREYAKSGHAGNTLLRKMIRRESAYPSAFRFSLLQILPKTIARDELLRREALYKAKLGTRATGLNLN